MDLLMIQLRLCSLVNEIGGEGGCFFLSQEGKEDGGAACPLGLPVAKSFLVRQPAGYGCNMSAAPSCSMNGELRTKGI
jgi:hypothetical protein